VLLQPAMYAIPPRSCYRRLLFARIQSVPRVAMDSDGSGLNVLNGIMATLLVARLLKLMLEAVRSTFCLLIIPKAAVRDPCIVCAIH
jgi:hypothetical protein